LDVNIIPQLLVNSIQVSLLYALIAVGLALILGVMKIIQFAHAQLYMLGAYAVYYVMNSGQVYALGILTAIFVGAIIGFILERGFFRRLRGQEMPSLILGIGLMLLIGAITNPFVGAVPKHIVPPVLGSLDLGFIIIPKMKLLISGISIVLLIFFVIFIRTTKSGQSMVAVAQDSDAALLQGVNVNRINVLGLVVAGILACLAGALIIPITAATPSMGEDVMFKIFIILIIGGMGSIPGAIVGAFVYGLLESVGYTYFTYGAPLLGFVVAILILVFRPRGLLGHE
jgi:branched-chain amino acid transport system permease protein